MRAHELSTEILLGGNRDYVIDGYLEIPSYYLEDMTMDIKDVVWGECKIGDEPYDPLLMILARSPLFRRLQAVEQLTLPADLSTIPNTSRFSRWQHIWGSLVFVRKMTEDDERYTERDRIIFQLRTLFSDLGQTAFSHLGDWVFQGANNGEDLHDHELRGLLEAFRVDELLAEYDIRLDEVVFPDKADFVEAPAPKLCTDRVDYGLREALRWSGSTTGLHIYKSMLAEPTSLFRINDDDQLEITNLDFARRFTAAYNILPTEHWAHPAHRLQLNLFQTAVKRSLVEGGMSGGIEFGTRPHPRDRLYGVDSEFNWAFREVEGVNLYRLMENIARDQRRIYSEARKHDLETLFANIGDIRQDGKAFPLFPHPLESYSWKTELYGLQSPHVDIVNTETVETDIAADRSGVTVGLPAMKPRSIDPDLFIDNHTAKLSDIDDSFRTFLEGLRDTTQLQYEARVLVNRRFGQQILHTHQRVKDLWPVAISRPRQQDNLRQIVEQAGLYGGARRFDNIYEL